MGLNESGHIQIVSKWINDSTHLDSDGSMYGTLKLSPLDELIVYHHQNENEFEDFTEPGFFSLFYYYVNCIIWVIDSRKETAIKMIVSGFIRQSSSLVNGYIPNDIIGLCFEYYGHEIQRLMQCKNTIHKIMTNERQRGRTSLLVLANNKGSDYAYSCEEIAEYMSLDDIPDRTCHVMECSSTDGDGLKHALGWIKLQTFKQPR